MSVAGKAAGVAMKATPVGRAASVAGKAAGAGKPKPKPPAGSDPRVHSPGSKAAQQRQQIEDIKARRKPDEPQHDDEHQDDEHQDDEHQQQDEQQDDGGGRRGIGNPLAGIQGPSTGGGFVLGVIVWAFVRAYIGQPAKAGQPDPPHGVDGMKRLARAKFLNKTD